jgi:WxcM-like, C-terminal
MTDTTIRSIRWIQFWQHDQNGVLSVFPANNPQGVPFPIARIFTITGVPAGTKRANHAHRACSQLHVCLSGSVEVLLNDGYEAVSLAVKHDAKGLLIPPLLWNTVTFENASTVLIVICDEPYDAGDYIRNWDDYLRLKRGSAHGVVTAEERLP